MSIKTITNADAMNFPVVADFVGKTIENQEWYKAISGEEFKVLEDTVVKSEAVENTEEDNTEDKAKKTNKK